MVKYPILVNVSSNRIKQKFFFYTLNFEYTTMISYRGICYDSVYT